MELGISIDIQDAVTALPFLARWRGIIHHIQFYLGANTLAEDIRAIHTVTNLFRTDFTYSFHAYGYLNLAEENHFVRTAWVNAGKESINYLKDIGGKFINFHMGYALSGLISHKDMLLYSKEAIATLCEYAQPWGISIDFENDFSSEHIKRLGDCPEDIDFFLSNKPTNLYCCFDIGHANISFPSPYLYRNWMEDIQSFHIHNNNSHIDEHIPIGGKGTIDLPMVYKELKAKSWGYAILENEFADYQSAIQFLHTSFG